MTKRYVTIDGCQVIGLEPGATETTRLYYGQEYQELRKFIHSMKPKPSYVPRNVMLQILSKRKGRRGE